MDASFLAGGADKLHQPAELLLVERHLRGHHQDAPPGVALHRRLEGGRIVVSSGENKIKFLAGNSGIAGAGAVN